MKIKTSRFGSIEINEEDIICFPSGILGFPQHKKYIILPSDDGPLEWLQCTSHPELAFVVCNPLVFKPDYTVPLSPDELAELGLENIEDGIILVIIVVPEDPYEMTANLLGPLLINRHNRRAKQLILTNTEYTTKHKVVGDSSRNESKQTG